MFKTFSIYIHLPFCSSRCPYCDFVSSTSSEIPFTPYLEALIREWRLRQKSVSGKKLRSIYLGGGTPSLWPADEIAKLLAVFSFASDVEVTVEVNPGDADSNWFAMLVDAGVNRFSIGVQALNDNRLNLLGRRHDSNRARKAVQNARDSQVRSVGADLIYATPGLTTKTLADELDGFIELGVDHVSAYELTICEQTPFGQALKAGQFQTVDDEASLEQWHLISSKLSAVGLHRYEVSSHARHDHRSRHNQHYWRGGVYIGLGAGAHGFISQSEDFSSLYRYANTDDVSEYLGAIDADHVAAFKENIDSNTHARELIMLGLRTTEGVDFNRVLSMICDELRQKWIRVSQQLQQEDLAHLKGRRLVASGDQMSNADGLALRFF